MVISRGVLKSNQASKMELIAKIVNGFQLRSFNLLSAVNNLLHRRYLFEIFSWYFIVCFFKLLCSNVLLLSEF